MPRRAEHAAWKTERHAEFGLSSDLEDALVFLDAFVQELQVRQWRHPAAQFRPDGTQATIKMEQDLQQMTRLVPLSATARAGVGFNVKHQRPHPYGAGPGGRLRVPYRFRFSLCATQLHSGGTNLETSLTEEIDPRHDTVLNRRMFAVADSFLSDLDPLPLLRSQL